MADFRLVHHGSFGHAVRTLCEQENDNFLDADACRTSQKTSIPIWLVMGQADLALIERTAHETDSTLVAAFLCGRYLVVTPCFGPHAASPESFSRRFLSSPPPGLSSEAVLALATRAGVGSGFDSPAYAPTTPLLARLFLKQQSSTFSAHAVLVDQAGMQHLHAPLIEVHGYGQRKSSPSVNRFTDFYGKLFQ